MCDFEGYREPEMVKRRPVVVISPKIVARPGLCTVVALSTTAPDPATQYHCQIDIRPRLPNWMESDGVWIKGDMIAVVAFNRLDFIRLGKQFNGRREYYYSVTGADFRAGGLCMRVRS
jgi:mRNA interferase MazF